MNTNLLDIVKQIIADYGEAILKDPQRLKAFFNDLAKDEPKPLRLAFGRCIESGAYTALKTAPDIAERALRKTEIAQRVNDEQGLDIRFCAEALDILEAALYGTAQYGAEQTTQKAPGTIPAPPPSAETPQNSADMSQTTTQKKKTKLWVIAALAVAVVVAVGIGLYQAEQAAAAERARVQARARALAIEQEMAEDRARAQAVVAEKAAEQAAVAERARAQVTEQAAVAERARTQTEPVLAPPFRSDREFVLNWCHQFAQYEPEDVGLILMNYFEYDIAYLYPANPYYYRNNPDTAYFNWDGLRKCIENRKLVAPGYCQLFYLIVRERYPDVKYIVSDQLSHARNSLNGVQWDITWLDDAGVVYTPGKTKFDFVEMQMRIAHGGVGTDWRVVNLVVGE
jgi:flagellar basal body-associated protein FliL